jgi:hypothetical protein
MALLITNCKVDIYRGYNAASPYPGGSPALAQVPAYLQHHLQNGRFGYNDPKVKWTHLLWVNPGTDVRSAYNSWTGPAEAVANADTVVINDYPLAGQKTAFYVVMVQRRRGRPGDSYKCYLDRARTQYPVQLVNVSCGPCGQMPMYWSLTTGPSDFANNACSGCAALDNQTWTLTYTGSGCQWYGPVMPAVCQAGEANVADQGPVRWSLFYDTLTARWRLFLELASALSSIIGYDPIDPASFNCQGSNTFVNPFFADNCCNGSASATIVPA